MLKLAGETNIGLEKIEQITYSPGCEDTGDLEASTKTITATSEASGLENADYSAALTLPKPDDARLVIQRVCARINLVIDSMTAGILYTRVYVDAQDADHRLWSANWNAAGDKKYAADFISGTVFDLLSDGQEHTFYFYHWVDTGNAVLSLVQLWEGVGSQATSARNALSLTHNGLISFTFNSGRIGTGTKNQWFMPVNFGISMGTSQACLLLYESGNFQIYGTVDTDLNYISMVTINLRSEQ